MDDIYAITINNKEYLIMKEIISNGIKYVYLCNENDPKDIIVRKVVNEDVLERLSSKEEFDFCLKLFEEQNK